MTKVLLFGIDGGEPSLVFERWRKDLPNLDKLMQKGCYARMNSAIPPNTIVAWNSMISGRDTSEIGVFSYTFKDKDGQSKLVSSKNIKCKLMWDILAEHNKRSLALYVPLSYPAKAMNGCMITDFLTPGVESECTYPSSLREELKQFPDVEYFFDVVQGLAGHKSLDEGTIVKRSYAMTEMQIEMIKRLITREKWDFTMSVMIGSDRLQHMLWRHFDETHRRHIKDSPFKEAIPKYYQYLDQKLGEVLSLLDDDTVVIIASDHGMVKQEGKININLWLLQKGYLVLKEGVDPSKKQKFSNSFVDMEKSFAYGGGAYNARVFLNKKVLEKNYESFKQKIIEELKAIPDDQGRKLETHIYTKEEVYKHSNDPDCPDLTIYFDNLRWASNPDFGSAGMYSWESAVGADSAGHSTQGLFIIAGKGISNKGNMGVINIQEVAPTIMQALDVPIPKDLKVKPLPVFEENKSKTKKTVRQRIWHIFQNQH